MLTIYHNPRCSKSREALQLIQDRDVDVTIVEYLKEIPTPAELKSLIEKLGIKPFDLIRKNEAAYKDNYKGKDLSNEEWVLAMVEEPKLIERPIIVKGNKAVLGRPPQNVLELI